MARRLLKYFVWTAVTIIGLIVLVGILLYLPPVQDFAKRKASEIVYNKFGMNLSVERLRLRFPLTLEINKTLLTSSTGDTIIALDRLSARVALYPLITKRVKITELEIEQLQMDYADSLDNFRARGGMGLLTIRGVVINLGSEYARVSSLRLRDADVDMMVVSKDEPDSVSAPLKWRIRVDKTLLERVKYRLAMAPDVVELDVDLERGELGRCRVDLEAQSVRAAELQMVRGDYSYLVDSQSKKAEPVVLKNDTEVVDTVQLRPWTIELGGVELVDNSFRFGELRGRPARGLDPKHIEISGINLNIDSIYNRGLDVNANITKIELRERSGVEVKSGTGRFKIDSTGVSIREFSLKTAHSQLSANLELGRGAVALNPDATIDGELSGVLSMVDYLLISPSTELKIPREIRRKKIVLDGKLHGTLGAVELRKLNVKVPDHLELYASGQIRSLLKPSRLSGNIRFNGSLRQLDIIKEFIPDTLLRERIGFPEHIKLGGSIAIAGSRYIPNIRMEVDSGSLDLKGDLNMRSKAYEATLVMDNFPLHQFLPHDTLGMASLDLNVKGVGFDPSADGAVAQIGLSVRQFDFKRYNYHDISLTAKLEEHLLTGHVNSNNEALAIGLDINGKLYPGKYSASLSGGLSNIDLRGLNFSRETLSISGRLVVETSIERDKLYGGHISFDSITITQGIRTQRLDGLRVIADADRSKVSANITSGDLTIDLNIPVGFDSLGRAMALLQTELARQIGERNIDMSLIQPLLPPINITMSAARNNSLRTILMSRGIDFKTINASITSGEKPFRSRLTVNGLKSFGIVFDTLTLGAGIRNNRLDYYLRLANRPGNLEQLALFYIYGNVQSNLANVNFYQQNRNREVGFNLGFSAEHQDSSVLVKIKSESPILAYNRWTVNADNYVEYGFERRSIIADLRLESAEQRIELLPAVGERYMPEGSLRATLQNIDLKRMLDILPKPPPIEGRLNLQGLFGIGTSYAVGTLKVGVDGLVYDKMLVGDIATSFATSVDTDNVLRIVGSISTDSVKVFTIKGKYDIDDDTGLRVDASLNDLPLSLINPFLVSQGASLEGNLAGLLKVTGKPSEIEINGDIRFNNAALSVAMVGTKYKFSPNPITVSGSKVRFDNFGMTAPNQKLLAVNGTFDMRDFSRLYSNLKISTKDFKAIASDRKGGSQIFGKAFIDMNASVVGPLDAMSLRGSVKLLNGTDVTYTMRDSPLDVSDKEQKIVKFVVFADSLYADDIDSVVLKRVWAVDMLLNVDIDDDVKVTMNLSENGNNRVELIGGGALTYSMNVQGDSRLSGRYVLSGGNVVYHPPVISTKEFEIKDGSYVEWVGAMLNPSFNISAVDRLNSTVTTATGTSAAIFDVSILISNTLKDMKIGFDLSSPGELQAEIGSLTAEERNAQAMSLLLYNTYTGPGASGKVDTNNPLNEFVAKELNQWARNNLKGIELSVGISSVDDGYGESHTDYSYKVSKNLFSDRVKVSIGGSVSDEGGASNTADNFIEDVSVEYRISKGDNMFLKAYRYNTQESILEGEVIETGAGFVVRKKMNHLKEIFRLTPKAERRERKAAERLEKEQKREQKKNDKQKEKEKKSGGKSNQSEKSGKMMIKENREE